MEPIPLKIVDSSYAAGIDPSSLFDGTMPEPDPKTLVEPGMPVDVSHVVAMLSASAFAPGLSWTSPQERRETDVWVASRLLYLYRPSMRDACNAGAWAWILLREAKAAKAKGHPSYVARRWGKSGKAGRFLGPLTENAISRLWMLAYRTCVNGLFCKQAFLNSELTQDLIRNDYSKNPLLAKAISLEVYDKYQKTAGTDDEFDTSCVKGLSMELNLILSSMSSMGAYPYEFKKDEYEAWSSKAPSCKDHVNYETINVGGVIGPNVVSVPDENEFLRQIRKNVLDHVNIEACYTYKDNHVRNFYWITRNLLHGMKEARGVTHRVAGVIERLAKSSAKVMDGTGKECLSTETASKDLESFLGCPPSASSETKLMELGNLFVEYLNNPKTFNANPSNSKLRQPFAEMKKSMRDVYEQVKDDISWDEPVSSVLESMFKT